MEHSCFRNSNTGEEGLEPPTPRFVAACSNPLSYTPYINSIPLHKLYVSCFYGFSSILDSF